MIVENERGSVLPLFALLLGATVLSALLLSAIAVRAVQRADAQTAADLAALAAVVEGEDGAVDLAARNGAVLVSYRLTSDFVEVVVAVDGVEAAAYAALTWDSIPIGGP